MLLFYRLIKLFVWPLVRTGQLIISAFRYSTQIPSYSPFFFLKKKKLHPSNNAREFVLCSQGNGIIGKSKYGGGLEKPKRGQKSIDILEKADEMLTQKNIEAVLFKGKKMIENTNLEKLEAFAGEVIKEQERRKTSVLPTVLLKQAFPSPRTSSASATTLSTISSC